MKAWDGSTRTHTQGTVGKQGLEVKGEATGVGVGPEDPPAWSSGAVGFQRGSGPKGAEKGAGPALHAEPLTSLRAGDPAPSPGSAAPPRAPAPEPSAQDPNKTRAPRCRDPALPGNKKSLAYWPRIQLATRPVRLSAIGQHAGVPSLANGT